ncbi:MAG: hypothetical protein JSR97_10300 [Verrucomicrobia bacterium]|nr:hypothetical protein [Verrucomicrobiota bacterium]
MEQLSEEERELLEALVESSLRQSTLRTMGTRLTQHAENYIQLLAEEISDYLPEYVQQFKTSELYKSYQAYIKDLLCARVDPNHLPIIQLQNKQQIRLLNLDGKRIRKKFFDAASAVMRKLKKHVYHDTAYYKKCHLCKGEIKVVCLTCVPCGKTYHPVCIQNNQDVCFQCGRNFSDHTTNALYFPIDG